MLKETEKKTNEIELKTKYKKPNSIVVFMKDLLILVVITKLVTMTLLSLFIISGQSMYSAYYDKELIIVDRLYANTLFGFKDYDIKRGDVVVIRPEINNDKEYFIKRIIGLSGEKVKIEGGEVYIQEVGKEEFVKLDEKYLNEDNYGNTKALEDSVTYEVPEGKIFVMGDNRNHSSDSRTCFSNKCSSTNPENFVANDKLVGKLLIDLGYFNFSEFSFKHSDITENGMPIDTTPKWLDSVKTYDYKY